MQSCVTHGLYLFRSNAALGSLNWPPSPEVMAEFNPPVTTRRDSVSTPLPPSSPKASTPSSPTRRGSPTKGRGSVRTDPKVAIPPPPKPASTVGKAGSRSLFEILAATQADKRFTKLFAAHEGKTPLYRQQRYSAPRSYHVRPMCMIWRFRLIQLFSRGLCW